MIPIYNFLFLIFLISSLFITFSSSQGLPIPTETATDSPPVLGEDGDPNLPTRNPLSYIVGPTKDPNNTPLPTESPTELPTVPVLNQQIDVGAVNAGKWQSSYAVHSNFMLDQERGTYTMQTYHTSSWSSVSASTIASWKSKYYNTLVLLLITLDSFKSSDISATILSKIHAEFQIYRSAGIKTIIRVIYHDDMGSSKPWGDATSSAVVFRHIDQLTPIFRMNEDIISFVQGGLVGLWGEWYYTDSFGDQNSQSSQQIADRKTVITKLMAAFPNRAVQVRTPYWMKKFFGNNPLTAPSYNTELGKAGHHNDCYLADSSDMGTYDNFASEYAYLAQQSKFTPTIFETCVTGSSRSLCPTALKETAGLHMVSGHRLYNTAVWNQWISGGCYDTILKNMGHRLEFMSSTVDIQTNIGSAFTVNVNLRNSGYASPANSRKTEVILRNVDGSSYCVATLNYDIRSLQSGTTATINSYIRLPTSVSSGRYEILMQFADPYTTLYGVPWYKIQAANTNIYESGTGFHKLNAVLDVLSPASSGATYTGEVIAKCGLSLSSIINSTVTSADSSCLTGYYKVNNVCTYCPPGSSCSSASSSPATCSAGTYSVGGQSSCLKCPSTCSNHGSCSTKTGACVCNSGFQGYDCSLISGNIVNPTQSNTPTTQPPVVTPTTKAPVVTPTTMKPVVPTTSSPNGVTVKPTTILVPPTTIPTISNCPPSSPSLLTNDCMLYLWRKAGCSTSVFPDTALTIAFWKGLTTISAVESDMNAWATLKTEKHVLGCYGSATNAPTMSPSITPTTIRPTGTGCPKQVNLLSNPAFGFTSNKDGTETATSWTSIGSGYDITIRKEQPTLKLSSFSVSRNIGAYQTITLPAPTKQAISFGGYISTAYVTGSIDYKFSLQLTLTYTDGTTENKSIYLQTGSYGWTWKSMTFTPSIAVIKIDYKITMVGHTGYAYLTQPVVGIVQQCAMPLVTSGDSPLLSTFDSPIAFDGAFVLSDTGSDADSPEQETSTSVISTTIIIIIAACGGAVLLIAAIVASFFYRKRRAQKLDTAINNQLTSV